MAGMPDKCYLVKHVSEVTLRLIVVLLQLLARLPSLLTVLVDHREHGLGPVVLLDYLLAELGAYQLHEVDESFVGTLAHSLQMWLLKPEVLVAHQQSEHTHAYHLQHK